MTPRQLSEQKRFSLVRRARSFVHAGRGLVVFLRSTHNAWIHIAVFIGVLLLGIHYALTKEEWIMLIIVSGMVFIAEAFNTAIEIDIDLTSPEEHPYARDTKDVAAGAVLLSALTAVIVGAFIFLPYIRWQ